MVKRTKEELIGKICEHLKKYYNKIELEEYLDNLETHLKQEGRIKIKEW
jgi:nucleoid DNA-binding protein